MYSLFILNDGITNGYEVNVLYLISLLSILFGIFVIISKNPIVSVLFLIFLFSSIATYLILLNLTFIGLSYIIVYIGAVSILFLFILMLINVRTSELQSNTRNSLNLAIITGFIFFQVCSLDGGLGTLIINNNLNNIKVDNYIENNTILDLCLKNLERSPNNFPSFVTSKIWDKNLIENTDISSIGNIMYTNYNIWLIMTSFILLLAMVGAIIITIKQKD